MADKTFSDKALSILTFAAYHSLLSGEQVKEVVIDDGEGHKADHEGLDEMTSAGLLETAGDRARFSDSGVVVLEKLMSAIRGVQA